MSKCLLLDAGSTSMKWALFDRENGVKSAVSSIPFPKPISNSPPVYEVAVEDIFQSVMYIVEKSAPIDRIFISVQMHGYMIGTSDGKLLTPYISWRDQRSTLSMNGSSFLEQFPLRLPPESGSRVKPNLPICGLFAMKHLDPERFFQATQFFTLGSYLAYCLTHVNATHITDAAASGMYNSTNGLPQYNIFPSLTMPEAVMKVQPVGYMQHMAVYTPIGDQQASVLGSKFRYESQYVLNLGTAAQLCVISDTFVSGDFESRPYFGGKTLCTVSGLPGGREIADQGGSGHFAIELADRYLAAMEKLPKRRELMIIGGVSRYHRELIIDVCCMMQIPCQIQADADALDGWIEFIREEEIS